MDELQEFWNEIWSGTLIICGILLILIVILFILEPIMERIKKYRIKRTINDLSFLDSLDETWNVSGIPNYLTFKHLTPNLNMKIWYINLFDDGLWITMHLKNYIEDIIIRIVLVRMNYTDELIDRILSKLESDFSHLEEFPAELKKHYTVVDELPDWDIEWFFSQSEKEGVDEL